jgi:hypothetical protein
MQQPTQSYISHVQQVILNNPNAIIQKINALGIITPIFSTSQDLINWVMELHDRNFTEAVATTSKILSVPVDTNGLYAEDLQNTLNANATSGTVLKLAYELAEEQPQLIPAPLLTFQTDSIVIVGLLIALCIYFLLTVLKRFL